MVICSFAGIGGNTASNTLVDLPIKPQGVDSAVNETAFTNGAEEETSEAQKTRFQKFINAQARGVLQAIEYGAETAIIQDANGTITERIGQAKVFEYLPERKVEVDIYL